MLLHFRHGQRHVLIMVPTEALTEPQCEGGFIYVIWAAMIDCRVSGHSTELVYPGQWGHWFDFYLCI